MLQAPPLGLSSNSVSYIVDLTLFRSHLESLIDYVDVGVKEGATLAYGGKQCDMPGLYMQPTVLTDVKDHMWIAKEESFGPIMVVSRFDDG